MHRQETRRWPWACRYWASNSRSLSLIARFGDGAEIIDEELAVEVIGLVLDGAAEEVFALVLDQLSLEVVGLDLDLLGPANLRVKAGEAQAALLVLDRRMPLDDLGIDEDHAPGPSARGRPSG